MKLLVTIAVLSIGTLSCAHRVAEEDLAIKVSREPAIASQAELQTKATVLIENSDLSPEKKAQLQNLNRNTAVDMEAYREESLKLRSILMKNMFSSDYDKVEVKLIQSKIRKLEDKRLALMFTTIDKANGIFGRETKAEENERILQRMMDENRDFY